MRARRRLAVFVFLVVFLAVVVGTFVLPKKYESQMEILLTNERPELVVSPSQGSDVSKSDTVDETRVNSEIELLRSSDIMREVVTQCHLAGKHARDNDTSGFQTNPVTLEKAQTRLRHDLQIEPITKTNLIRISYSSTDPQLSVSVLQTLTRAYLDEHLAVRGSSATYSFFAKQVVNFALRLKESRAKLADFRRLHPVTVDDERNLLLQQRSQSEMELNQTDEGLRAESARASAAELQISGTDIPARIVTDTKTVPNEQAIQQLTTLLVSLRNSRTDWLNQYRADDRRVKVIDDQIANTEQALNRAETRDLSEHTTNVNPVKQSAELELARASLNVAGLTAKSEAIRSQQLGEAKRLQQLEDANDELAVLTAQVKQDASNYDAYAMKAEQAHVEDLLDAQRIANVAVVEKPTASHIPSSPKVGTNLAFGFMLALFAAAAAIFFAEMFKATTLA